MPRNFRLRTGFKRFLRNLTVALAANLAIFWMMLPGDTPAILLCGVTAAIAGAWLLMLLGERDPPGATQGRTVVAPPTRRKVKESPRYFRTRPVPRTPGRQIDRH